MLISRQYTLNPESIDLISEEIVGFCIAHKISSKEAYRVRLSAEEYLIQWQDAVAANTPVTLKL